MIFRAACQISATKAASICQNPSSTPQGVHSELGVGLVASSFALGRFCILAWKLFGVPLGWSLAGISLKGSIAYKSRYQACQEVDAGSETTTATARSPAHTTAFA